MRSEVDPAAEDGVALVGAMLAVVILSGISVFFVTTALGQSRFSAESRDRELALHVAETGAEQLVAILNSNPQHAAPPPDAADPYVRTASDGDQKAWALRQLAAASPSQVTRTPGGRALAIRPLGSTGLPLDVVIGVGEVNGPAGLERRVVRLVYDRGYYSPNHAFLSGGYLEIEGTPAVVGSSANVHANGNLFVTSGPVIAGALTTHGTSTGTSPPRGSTGQPIVTIPRIEARTFYERRSTQPDWYDLCPDGRIHSPAANGQQPCTGPVWSSGTGRGWSLNTATNTWNMVGNGAARGTYYVYQANGAVASNVGSGGTLLPVTVIVDKGAGSPATSGNFSLTGGPDIQPHLAGVLAIADRDVILAGNADSPVYGFIGAAEQARLEGNPWVVGSVIAEYRPHTVGSPVPHNRIAGNPRLEYNGGLSIPLDGLVRVTAWNEL